MNVIRQARRFDREGNYVRRWVPELAGLETSLIHEPWKLERSELDATGYPVAEVHP